VRKRQVLQEAEIQWPSNVRFVPVDFARENFPERLAAAGFDLQLQSLFLWEGVSYYLPEAAVDGVLEFVARCPPGSCIAFDYAILSFVTGDHSTYGGKSIARWLEEIGEPFLFGIDPKETESFLKARRLALVSDLGPKEFEQMYLRTRRGGTLGPALGHVRMALARVVDPG
jgi:methyltransferase (TIGR00027 family)